jgi:conjugal transfer pilus assembly protein TraD
MAHKDGNLYITGLDARWRPNYEETILICWLGASAFSLFILAYLPVPRLGGLIMSGLCILCAFVRGIQAKKRGMVEARMNDGGIDFISLDALRVKCLRGMKKNQVWLGYGFNWSDSHSQRLYQLISYGVSSVVGSKNIDGGAYWLHGFESETDIYQDLPSTIGHTLIVGTTRVGKTRMFDLLIGQAIIRNEPVIVIDPKGDHGLAANMQAICDRVGRSNAYAFFSPAYPDRSVSIDPLKNWNRHTELASRIAALIPSETKGDPFTAFSWKVLNDIINGLVASDVKPKLIHLRRYVEGGPDDLVEKALRRYFDMHIENWESVAGPYIQRHRGDLIRGYIDYYRDQVIRQYPSVELDGLISTYEHNRDHFQKMIASLIPILSMLTSRPLDVLLSPEESMGSNRQVVDMARVCRDNMVLYVGLDSLSDSVIGSAIGSILMSDLTAVAGARYNYSRNSSFVNLFVDEAAEVINDPTIQLMNKGSGAGIRVYLATQTLADFEARLGSPSKARQVLGNANNRIIFRVMDGNTQEYLVEGMPTISYKRMDIRYGHSVDSNIYDPYKSQYMEQASEEEATLIPQALLGEFPPLHYLGRLAGGRTIKGRIPILQI